VTADRNPLEDAVEQALDVFVYAPIGLLFDGPGSFPKLVRNGRNQVSNARMMGRFAVRMGRSEVEKRSAELDGAVIDLLRGLGVVPAPPVPAATPTEAAADAAAAAPTPSTTTPKAKAAKAAPASKTAKKAATVAAGGADDARTNRTAAKKAAAARPAAVDAATPSVDVLPIPDYDSLSASQVVTRLRGLPAGQLEAVRAYEAATRGRKTILNRIQQLAKP